MILGGGMAPRRWLRTMEHKYKQDSPTAVELVSTYRTIGESTHGTHTQNTNTHTTLTSFQMGTVALRVLIANSTASRESFRCTDDTAMMTLASPTAVIPSRCTKAIRSTFHLARTYSRTRERGREGDSVRGRERGQEWADGGVKPARRPRGQDTSRAKGKGAEMGVWQGKQCTILLIVFQGRGCRRR